MLRAGALPADGSSSSVAGVALPAGSRCRHVWVSDGPVDDAVELASRLAAVFERTGLWPVPWSAQEDPDPYLQGPDDAGAGIDDGDAEGILRKLWKTADHPSLRAANAPFGAVFPGLAPGSPGARIGAAARDPFRAVARTPPAERGDEKPWLLLVPANRPADVPAALAVGLTEDVTSDHAVSTVLRSWEERFGAVLVEVAPSSLALVVDRPVIGNSQALKLAAEHAALAPQPDGARPGTIRDVAGLLRRGRPVSRAWGPELPLTPQLWELGWFD